MDPNNIPFNALVIGPTNSGKSSFVVDQLCGPFRGKFDFIVLICPTFTYNKTYHHFAEADPRFFFIICEQNAIEPWLEIVCFFLVGTNALIILDDCAASKDVKKRTGQLVNLAFSAHHTGLSVWVLNQKMTSITASFRENVAAIVLFYTPSWKTLKAVFEDYAGELSQNEYKEYVSRLKKQYVFLPCVLTSAPFRNKIKTQLKIYNLYCNEVAAIQNGDTINERNRIERRYYLRRRFEPS